MRKQYPYQHLELKDLRGEKWKWIPWLHGFYKISNFGRVKRETFEIVMKDGMRRTMHEKIMAADLQKFPNAYMGDQVYHLRVKILREDIKYEIGIARVVYYCFKRKFDLNDPNQLAITIDGDGRNIHLGNIALVNRNQKQRRIFERKRFKKPVVYSFDESLSGLKKSANPNCRQVTQYAENGKKVRTYLSIKAAAVSLSLSESGINSALRGRQARCGGYVWRYGSANKVNLQPSREQRAMRIKLLRGSKVSQYDTRGNRLNTFITMVDAAKLTGIQRGDISSAASGKQQSAGGFIWRKGWGSEKIEIEPDSFGEFLRAKTKWKKIRQYSLDGKYIRTFQSIKEAASSINTTPSNISSALTRKSAFAGGYLWRV